jgi:hypothetical protein
MTRAELGKALVAAGVSEIDFDLSGSVSSNDAWVLEDAHGIWHVYYQERGKRYDERHFLSENEACLFILNKLSPGTSQG